MPATEADPPAAHRAPIAILSYHQTVTPAEGIDNPLVIEPATFALQMSLLHALGWHGLSLRDLEPYLRGERTGRVFGITLDDGYANNFEHALPVLQRYGYTATSFVVSACIGGTNAWDRGLGMGDVRVMDRAQMRAWVAAGMEIGGHTRHHVRLPECDDARARAEITDCKAEIEDALGQPIRSFCYPHGEFLPRHTDMVREAGFHLATTVRVARVPRQPQMLRLPRISVHAHDATPLLIARVVWPLEEWRSSLRGLRRRLGVMAGPMRGT